METPRSECLDTREQPQKPTLFETQSPIVKTPFMPGFDPVGGQAACIRDRAAIVEETKRDLLLALLERPAEPALRTVRGAPCRA